MMVDGPENRAESRKVSVSRDLRTPGPCSDRDETALLTNGSGD